MLKPQRKRLKQQTNSNSIIHFDCFYASVFENENPALRSLPLAVQQKQIVVTCNYEARKRGLNKLQLIRDAKRICPEVVIVLGEDLTRFRNASKELYGFLKAFSWNNKVERLGFDEVFMDVSDIIDYNVDLLNPRDLSHSYFYLDKNDPTIGFAYDASRVAGSTYPSRHTSNIGYTPQQDALQLRLHLASHLAQHLREALHSQKGYTCTAGISVNKVLAKLVGNLHKPHNQTTLFPSDENVASFLDTHEVGKIPGIGFKLAAKLRAHVLEKTTSDNEQGDSKEALLVGEVRKHPDISPETLERILGGPGTPQSIGSRIWDLLNGYDDTEVGKARDLPRQISIEDSYIRLDSMGEVVKELRLLAVSLLKRMHVDLLEDDDEDVTSLNADSVAKGNYNRRWVAFPKTIRLSTRPRLSQDQENRHRASARISRSAPMPNFMFSLKESLDSLSERLVSETLLPLFRRLHPEKSWNLSLMNIAVTNIADAASEKGGGVGRDIAKMFRRQDDVLKQWKVEDTTKEEERKEDTPPPKAGIVENNCHANIKLATPPQILRTGSEDFPTASQEDSSMNDGGWESEDEDMMDDDSFRCELCGAIMPVFAMAAHGRWHAEPLQG